MCWKCGETVDVSQKIYRTSECPVCGADMHCCRNCRFYTPGRQYDCRENIDEPVSDKERANFCDSFSVRADFENTGSSGGNEAGEARKAFDSLFGSLICP